MRWIAATLMTGLVTIPVGAFAGPNENANAGGPKPVKLALAPQPSAPANQIVTVEEFRAAIAKSLEKQSAGKAIEFEIALLSPDEAVTAPAGELDLKVRALRGDELVGRRSFEVSVLVKGKPVHHLRVVAQIDAHAEVVTASRYIKPDDTISAEDLAITRVQLPPSATDFVFDIQEVVGRRAVRPLQADRPIRGSGIAQAYTIRKGDRVSIEVKRGGLNINAVGVSKNPGAIGQVITVTNQDSGKDLRAKVIGPGTVQVEF